jgi:hypothetical protein
MSGCSAKDSSRDSSEETATRLGNWLIVRDRDRRAVGPEHVSSKVWMIHDHVLMVDTHSIYMH